MLVAVSYQKFGRLKLAGNIVGSDMPGVNSRKSTGPAAVYNKTSTLIIAQCK